MVVRIVVPSQVYSNVADDQMPAELFHTSIVAKWPRPSRYALRKGGYS